MKEKKQKRRSEEAHSLEARQFAHKVFKDKRRENRKLVRNYKESWLTESEYVA
jgi:hypothetical protein